ncbi:hypothetical protein SKAU_G00140350 [Synaphobranchus kaupii]|uniref:Uncharacterized protein n=1 Tax=Synaphobranchus kaupii TaxID=118154 RepID=A0A9Q1FSK1_SYNKA|nr:hypothetical protein SKAU_G00140350 [Synaphobranchus kaupii]
MASSEKDHITIQRGRLPNPTECRAIWIAIFQEQLSIKNTLYTDVDWTADHSCITTASTARQQLLQK